MTRVLVTGASGFVGQHLIPKLIELGYDVFGLDRYVTKRYNQQISNIYADITDPHSIRQALHSIKPDIIIHLAAISANGYAYDHPQEVIEVNYLGTVNLAEISMRELPNLEHFLFAGSSEEYGSNHKAPFDEKSTLMPHSPYAASKASSDMYLQYMYRAYDFPVTILRNFNTYGRIDNTHFVVEKIIVQALTKKLIELGDPYPIRDFLYIDDHVNSYLKCIEQPDKSIGQTFVFCTGIQTQISELVNKIVGLTKFTGERRYNTIPRRPLDIPILYGNPAKAKTILGWEAKISLDVGLERTVAYWKNSLIFG